MLVALVIFGYSAHELTLIYLESTESVDTNKSISNMFMQAEPVTDENGEVETDNSGEAITMNNASGGVKFVWDYDLLLSYNAEAKGYIRQGDGEYIDNPILQHTDNDYYLNHLPNNVQSSVGSIYIDYRIEEGLNAKNCILYGHMMGSRVNYTMFGSLAYYWSQPKYGEEHPDMDIYIGPDHYKYYVFSVFETEAVGSDTYQYKFADDESFMKYVNSSLEKSKYKFPQAGEITADDTIITLSTCTPRSDEKYRLIVQLVRREKVDDSADTEK